MLFWIFALVVNHIWSICIALGLLVILINNARVHSNSYKCKTVFSELLAGRYALPKYPLANKWVLITGASAGIGLQMSRDFVSMGANVIMAVRNKEKAEEAKRSVLNDFPKSPSVIEVMTLDTSNLDSVRLFCKQFLKTHVSLHFVILNAGIHYMAQPGCPLTNYNMKQVSEQGYDLSFATNYMGHFLLTALLLPLLTSVGAAEGIPTRVIHIASSMHVVVNGEMLRTKSAGVSAPTASSKDNENLIHRHRAYGNSKLAQIMHAYELNRRIDTSKVQIIAVCPGWVSGTGIAPTDAAGRVIHALGYDIEYGSLAPIGACLSPFLNGGEFVTNYIPHWNMFPLHWLPQRIRDAVGMLIVLSLLLTQSHTYGLHVTSTTKDAYNREVARELFEWTEEAVGVKTI